MLPGDAVIVRAGVYREQIQPLRGGTSVDQRITYAAYTGEDVVVSGADVLTNWTQSGNAWRRTWTVSLCADTTKGNIYRREMVIVDGKVLKPVFSRAEVVAGTFFVEGTPCAPTAIYVRLPGDVAPSG